MFQVCNLSRFQVLLSHIDRNNNLCAILQSDLSELWSYLFSLSFNPETGEFMPGMFIETSMSFR